MKIVQVSPYAMDRPGGVQSHIRALSGWLRSRGHEVRIVAPPGASGDDGLMALGRVRQISVHGTRFELTRATRAELADCLGELRGWGAEILHLHTPWTPMLPWQVWRGMNLPAVATFHATLPESEGPDPLAWALRKAGHYFNRRLAGIAVPSDGPLAQWRKMRATPLPRVLPPAIDLADWRAAGRAAQASEGLRVVYMGRLEERKGVAVLLRAWERVHAERADAELIIAGHGPEEAALRRQAESAGLQGVTFRPAPDAAEARALVAGADLFVAPALAGESFGLVLIEAMAAGTLPVAAANAGYASVLTGMGRELLVPPGESWALARKILELASDTGTAARLRRWAAAHAEGFDLRSAGATYESWFAEALRRR